MRIRHLTKSIFSIDNISQSTELPFIVTFIFQHVNRLSKNWPFFRITGPPQYVNMSTMEVFETLDWTNETTRETYQGILLKENAHMGRSCYTAEGSALVNTFLRPGP